MDDAQGQSVSTPAAPTRSVADRINHLAGARLGPSFQGGQPESLDDRIGAAAEVMLNDIDNNIDPNQNGLAEDYQEPEQAEQTPEPEVEAEQATQPEDDGVDFELHGKKYSLPPELKEALAQKVKAADADYTRKSQEVGESRKQVERMTQAAKALFEQAQQFAPYYGQAHQIEAQISELQKQLTPELRNNDPVQFSTLGTELNLLMFHRQQLQGHLQQAGQEFTQQMHMHKLQALAAEIPRLQKDIPGFEKPEFRADLAKWGREQGLSDQDIGHINFSAPMFRLLHLAREGLNAKTESEKKAKELPAKVKGLPPVKPTGRVQNTSEQRNDQTRKNWKRDGAKFTDPRLDQMLSEKLDKFFRG